MGYSDADAMGRGGKTGSGRMSSESQQNQERRERLRKLALETVDLNKDPYFMRNHLGTYECKLCLTIHSTEGNYLAHTQGKRHQTNIARRAARDAWEAQQASAAPAAVSKSVRKTVKIGRPGYRVTKQRDPESGQRSLLFLIDYPEIEDGLQPRHRFMSAYEQKVEAVDRKYQYILVAAEPYETIAFKVPNREIDTAADKFFTNWDRENLTFTLQLDSSCSAFIQTLTQTLTVDPPPQIHFKDKAMGGGAPMPPPPKADGPRAGPPPPPPPGFPRPPPPPM